MFCDDLDEFEPGREDSSSETFLEDMMAEAMRLLMRNQQLAALCDSIESREGEDVLR